MKTNRHPVDELADIRAEKEALTIREARARAQVMGLMEVGGRLSGDDYTAVWATWDQKGQIDEAAMKRSGLSPDEFRKPSKKVDAIQTVRRSRR